MALRVGRLDVDRMLDEIEPRQFDEWLAFFRVERHPDDELRRLIEVMKLGFTAMAIAEGMKTVTPESFDPSPAQSGKEIILGPAAARALIVGC